MGDQNRRKNETVNRMKTLYTYILISAWLVIPTLGSNRSEPAEKAKAKMSFEFFETTDRQYLKVRVKTKIEKKYKPVAEIAVSIYLKDQSSEKLIGRIITGEDGSGILILDSTYYSVADKMKGSEFIAVLEENQNFHDLTAELTIKKAEFNIEYIDNDSIKLIQVNISERDSSGILVPQKFVDLKFFVERPLGQLPIGDNYTSTDNDGNVSIIFPQDLPGDREGNVKVFVRIVDSENYGNVEKFKTLQWGIPTRIDDATISRSLWASGANAPILLLITVNSLILAAWGILIYIVVKIYGISKI
jgi:hypothetical protein